MLKWCACILQMQSQEPLQQDILIQLEQADKHLVQLYNMALGHSQQWRSPWQESDEQGRAETGPCSLMKWVTSPLSDVMQSMLCCSNATGADT